MKHKHAELMALYAQDAMETDKPWERWQHAPLESDEWETLKKHPSWLAMSEYRRKPKTIRIGNYDVPEPLRVAPENESYYYAITIGDSSDSIMIKWRGDPYDLRKLKNGLAHANQEAAELHAEALISLTQTKEQP